MRCGVQCPSRELYREPALCKTLFQVLRRRQWLTKLPPLRGHSLLLGCSVLHGLVKESGHSKMKF